MYWSGYIQRFENEKSVKGDKVEKKIMIYWQNIASEVKLYMKDILFYWHQ